MLSQAKELEQTLEKYAAQLRKIAETNASIKPAPTKWSKKEILGHLIDSAQNNLRRFIVAQYEESPTVRYQQDDWVHINCYQNYRFEELIQLWYLTNQQIVTVLENMDSQTAERTCNVGSLYSLGWLAADYIKHLKHHLHQLLQLEEIPYP
jgi:hypothetical protein